MSLAERAGLALMRKMDPEKAHDLALKALRRGLVGLPGPVTSRRLATQVAGLELPNPVGLAAGFDKNATAVAQLMRAGFGFVELGAATPKPQPGNPRPRLFRLTRDRAAINRFGFNNEGMFKIAERLSERPDGIPVGINLGANKTSANRAGDYALVLETCGPFVDFATVNVSSPNTERLRDLQGSEALSALLGNVLAARGNLPRKIPVFLKIAPDLALAELAEIAEVALARKVDAIIATNTTLSREGLHGPHAAEAGGLSGAPLFEKSTRILAQLSKLTDGNIPLIGVGGIGSAPDAYAKIKAGASAVQFYTAMVFEGISLAATIPQGLEELLARDGYANVAEAVGIEKEKWL